MEEGRSFGAGLDLRALRTELPPDTLVPGVAVYSRRADPLAAWTNGLDLAAVGADTDRAFLILETGFNQRWRCAPAQLGVAAGRGMREQEVRRCTGRVVGVPLPALHLVVSPVLLAGTARTAAPWRRPPRRWPGRRPSRQWGEPACLPDLHLRQLLKAAASLPQLLALPAAWRQAHQVSASAAPAPLLRPLRPSLCLPVSVPAATPALLGCRGLHFLAVMPDEDAEVCSGLWLLLDRKPPSV